MLEKDIEKYTKDRLKPLNCRLIKFVSPGESGVPDRLCLIPGGKIVFVEFKKPNGKLSERQKYWAEILVQMGFVYRQVWTMEQARDFVEEVRANE